MSLKSSGFPLLFSGTITENIRPEGRRPSGTHERRRPAAGSLRRKGQLQVVYDPVDDGMLRQEGNDLHCASAPRAEHRVNLIDLADYGRPAPYLEILQCVLFVPPLCIEPCKQCKRLEQYATPQISVGN